MQTRRRMDGKARNKCRVWICCDTHLESRSDVIGCPCPANGPGPSLASSALQFARVNHLVHLAHANNSESSTHGHVVLESHAFIADVYLRVLVAALGNYCRVLNCLSGRIGIMAILHALFLRSSA
jgi:hypothetical protein